MSLYIAISLFPVFFTAARLRVAINPHAVGALLILAVSSPLTHWIARYRQLSSIQMQKQGCRPADSANEGDL